MRNLWNRNLAAKILFKELKSSGALSLCAMVIIIFCSMQSSAAGTLDPTFGVNGEVDTRGTAFALQPDGKIVSAGSTGSLGSYDFIVRRYNANGSPDVFFGMRGKVVTAVTEGEDYATSLAIQPDGKIVVAGYAGQLFLAGHLILVRYHADGNLDESFGDGGISLVERVSSQTIKTIAVQPDGKIVVGGAGGKANQNTCSRLMLGRYTGTGALDRNFGRRNIDGGGIIFINLGSAPACMFNTELKSIHITPDGKILFGGGFVHYANGLSFLIGQYNRNGERDFVQTYRDSGEGSGVSHGFRFITKLPDGKILAIGRRVARFLDSGQLDPTFAPNSELQTPVPTNTNSGTGALLPDGKIAHATVIDWPSSRDTSLRLLSTDGLVLGQIMRLNHQVQMRAVLAQPDGKVIVIDDLKMRRYLNIASPE